MASFDEITAGKDEGAVLDVLLALLSGKGLPTSFWGDGDPIKTILRDGFSPLLATIYSFAADSAKGGALRLALGLAKLDIANWNLDPKRTFLGWLASENFSVTPRDPAFTVGTERIINSLSEARTLPAGARLRSTTGLYYALVNGPVTIAAGDTDYVTIRAEKSGAAYNLDAGTITALVTTVAGLAVSNQPEAPATSWLVTYGGDRETPDSVVTRCLANWGRLARAQALVQEAYAALALDSDVTGSSAATKASVWSHYRDGVGHAANYVTIYLAGDAGPVLQADADTVKAAINPYRSIHDELVVKPSGTTTFAPVGTAYVSSQGDVAGATAGITAAFAALQVELAIGQTVFPWDVRRALAAVPQITTFVDALAASVPDKKALITLSTAGITVTVGSP